MEILLEQLHLHWQTFINFFIFDMSRLDDPNMIIRLILQIFLLLCAAFFAGSETALFSLSRLDLQKLRKERNQCSEALHELLDQPRRLIISILSGNELVNIAATANMTGILVTLYGTEKAGWISTLIMVPLILLFGEVTPKTMAVSNPVRIGTLVASPMHWWIRFVAPLRWFIRGIADRVTTFLVGEEKAAENILQIDEFRSLVEEVSKEGELNATERALIYNLLEAGDTEVVEIMVPRTRTVFIDVQMRVPEMVEVFRHYKHPRVPVYHGQRDNLVGFLHAETILGLVLDKVDLSSLEPHDILHPPIVVPLTKKVDEMFDFFQSNNARAAVVLNEFGGVEGFVTIKDVLTFIFGQISGGVRGENLYQERDDNIYEVMGDMTLNDFNNLTHFGIEDPRMTTIGGVAFRHLDKLPQVNEQVVVEDIIMTVLEMDGHRISRLRVVKGITHADNVDEEIKEEIIEAITGKTELEKEKEDLSILEQPKDVSMLEKKGDRG